MRDIRQRGDLPQGRAERNVKVFTMHIPPSIAEWTFKLRNHLSLEFSPWYFQTTKSKTVDKGDGTTSNSSYSLHLANKAGTATLKCEFLKNTWMRANKRSN